MMVATRSRDAGFRIIWLGLAAVAPMVPALLVFFRQGVTDPVLSGDAATLELGVRHATHFVQLVGPYSRFGWSHPGPLYFYLAAPIYVLLQEHSSALNVFALMVNVAAAVTTVLIANQLRGWLFAMTVAVLLGVFELVAVPFLIANEWNPIVPILPIVCLSMLTARLASTGRLWSPAFVFLASAIVQTHVGYFPAVAALAGVVMLAAYTSRSTPRALHRRSLPVITIAMLALCWSLPLYESVAASPGNLQRVVVFFAPTGRPEHSLGDAVRVVSQQSAAMAQAIAETLSQREFPISLTASRLLGFGQVLALAALAFKSHGSKDPGLRALSDTSLALFAAALVAVLSIKGEILPYLVAWMAITGLMTFITLAALLPERITPRTFRISEVLFTISALALIGLAVRGPVGRSAPMHQSDVETAALADTVADYLHAAPFRTAPTLRIEPRDQWPTAVGIALYLHKRGIPIYVEREWLAMVGAPFAAPSTPGPILLVTDRLSSVDERGRSLSTLIASGSKTRVFLQQ
jgi:hypothetical protein